MTAPQTPKGRVRLPLASWMVISHLIVLALPVFAFIGTGTLAHELQMQVRGHLAHQGSATAHLVAPVLADGDPHTLGPALSAIEVDTGTRVWLLDAVGLVVASSDATDLGRAMHDRHDVGQALDGHQTGQMTDGPAGELLRMVVATPVRQHGAIVGVVLESSPPRDLLRALFVLPAPLSWGVLLALAITLGLSVGSGHMLSRSLRRLSGASHRIAEGAFDAVEELDRPGRSHVVEVGVLSGDLQRMAVRLEERLAYISEFAGNVSHEFKAPITTLRGSVELMRDDADMPPEQRARFLDNALTDLERMERLVSGLLALARAEEAGGRVEVDLDALLAGVLERHPTITTRGTAGAVTGNRAQLESAVENLIENARHHGGDGTRIELVAWASGAEVGVEVRDDGPGISEANLPQVFDRFFTTDRARGGAGLGLSLVRAICRAHGGDVSVHSAPGDTVFRVRLPVRSPSAPT
jgi:signal transduction histidine kinase